MKMGYYFAIVILVLAAILRAFYVPLTSIMILDSEPLMIAAFMSLGSMLFGVGTKIFGRKAEKKNDNQHLTRKDTPFFVILILAMLFSTIFTFIGLSMASASSASLVKCFILVATALIAMIFLKEKISRRLWIAIMLITLGCITIASGSIETIFVSPGLIFVFIACILIGVVRCCQKKLAQKNTGTIIMTSEFVVFAGCFILALILGERLPNIETILIAMLLGCLIYGLASFLFIRAARILDASRCAAVISLAPVLSAGLSLLIFQEQPSLTFYISLLLLIPGFVLIFWDKEEKAKFEKDVNKAESVSADSIITTPEQIKSPYHDIRNYLTAIGMVLTFGYFFLFFANVLVDTYDLYGSGLGSEILLALCILMIIIGTLLIILRHRDLAGMSFILIGLILGLLLVSEYNTAVLICIGILSILYGLILLTAKESKRIIFSIIFIGIGAAYITSIFAAETITSTLFTLFLVIFTFPLPLFASGLLPKLRMTHILCEDETSSFEKSGAMLCQLIFAANLLPFVANAILGNQILPQERLAVISLISGIIIIYVAFLMMFVGKNRFVSSIYLGIATFIILFSLSSGMMHNLLGIIMIILGILCLLQKQKSFLLLSLMCIITGIGALISNTTTSLTSIQVGYLVLLLVAFVLSIYIAFAIFSNRKKLPLF